MLEPILRLEEDLSKTGDVLGRIKSFCFPGGIRQRKSRAIRTTQAGEMRMSPEAGWIPKVDGHLHEEVFTYFPEDRTSVVIVR